MGKVRTRPHCPSLQRLHELGKNTQLNELQLSVKVPPRREDDTGLSSESHARRCSISFSIQDQRVARDWVTWCLALSSSAVLMGSAVAGT